MPGIFFTSWELWQQMTFVLAMGIVAVFCAGLGKLWWNNRLMRKQEVLDEEKRARVEEMRKTGLPIRRANPVPFGVRAIQSGVEVEGIWISRPASLNELGEKLASSTTLAGRDSDSHKKGRDYSGDEKSVTVTTTTSLDRAGLKQSPSAASILQRLTDTDSLESGRSSAPPVSQFAYKPANNRRQSSRHATTNTLNADTLRRLEGQPSPTKPHFDTYVPTSSPSPRPFHHHHSHQHHHLSQQSSASSSADSVDSQPRSVKSASGRSYTSSSHSSKLYMAGARNTNPHAGHAPYAYGQSAGRTGGYDSNTTSTPARTPSGFSAFSSSQADAVTTMMMAAPEPTFGPGDLHYNTSSRRVNDGFEVLPAGTFGGSGPGVMEGNSEMGVGRASKRSRKSGGQLELQGER